MYEICEKCPRLNNCMISADHCYRHNWIIQDLKADMDVYHRMFDLRRHIDADMDRDSE